MSARQINIDFARLGGPVYIGRDRGSIERDKYRLDELDSQNVVVTISIPSSTYSINSSFFLGLFGKSIRNAGSKDAFFQKFRFVAPDNIIDAIESYVERALYEKKILDT